MFNRTYNYINSFFSGDTELHTLLRTATTANEIDKFLLSQSREEIERLVHSVNNYGRLALDLIPKSKLSLHDKEFIERRLLYLALDHNGLALNKKISVENVISSKQVEIDEELNDLLEAANAARGAIKYSPTHADANEYEIEEFINIAERNKAFKDTLNSTCETYLTKQRSTLIKKCKKIGDKSLQSRHAALNDEIQKFIYSKFVENIKKTKTGTCEDFAIFSYQYLKAKKFQFPIKVIHNKKNNHTILVVLKNASADPCDPTNWKRVVDAFNGYIIADENKISELKLFRHYVSLTQKSYNLAVNYNPNYHTFHQSYIIESNSLKKPAPTCSFNIKKASLFAGAGLFMYAACQLSSTFEADENLSERLGM